MYRAVLALLLVALLVAFPLSLQLPAQASPTRQEAAILQGKTILFGISNGEGDPYDRGDPGSSRLTGLLERAGARVEQLNWGLPIPLTAHLVILVGPTRDYTGAQVARLWTYLEQGGSLLLLADPAEQQGYALPEASGLFELLFSDYGIRMTNGVLINPAADTFAAAPAGTADPSAPELLPTSAPGNAPVTLLSNLFSNNPQHPILIDVDVANVVLNAARPMEEEAVLNRASMTTLLYSSSQTYLENDLRTLAQSGVYLFDPENDLPQAAYLVAAISENTFTGTRLVMIGDGDIGRNNFGLVGSPPGSEAYVFPNTIRLLLNAIYWLLDVSPAEVVFAPVAPLPTGTPTLTPTPTGTAIPTLPPG